MLLIQDFDSALDIRLHSPFQDRASYIGASEIGQCLRSVLLNKLNPQPLDRASRGRMLAGRVMENEIIQFLRLASDHSIRETGRFQREYEHSHLPFRAHPDGRILREGGDGVLEVKTASAVTFKRYAETGLPIQYVDQVQAQMGLAGLSWALVVLVSRENLSELNTFEISFDPARYEGLLKRAEVAGKHLQAGSLPEGEPERGYCFTCLHATQCKAVNALRERGRNGEVSDVLRCQLEAQIEELTSLEADLDPLQFRASELRDQIKRSLQMTGLSKVYLDLATVQFIESTRTSFDAKALLREAPDVHARFLRTSTLTQLRITPKKGEALCLPTAS
jgi:hypothetical protein